MRSLIMTLGWLAIVGFLSMFTLVGYVVCFAPGPTPEQVAAEAAQEAERVAKAEAEREKEAAVQHQDWIEREALRTEAEAAAQKMNATNFARIHEGMTYEEVVAIVGPPSELVSSSQIGDIQIKMYQWNAGIVANANAMFQDGKMISKAQFGL
jgi:hypothetical protein